MLNFSQSMAADTMLSFMIGGRLNALPTPVNR
jgi:hypothetical protein